MTSATRRTTLWPLFRNPALGKFAPADGPHAMRGLEDRLWTDTGFKMEAASLSNKRVLLVGFSSQQRAALREMLAEIGVRMTAVVRTVQSLASIAELDSAFGIVIVDFDAFNDADGGVEALLNFRARSSRSPVILCSATVKGDDLTSERAAICDATLRMPGTRDRLKAALVAALENHWAHQRAHQN